MFKKIFTAAWMALLLACCQLAAAAPTVSVSATPSNPTAPATVTLGVTATSEGDPVIATQVEYFNGATSLGASVQSPFTLTLDNLAAGTYQITAKVSTTDPANPVLQSAPLAVAVGTPPGAATAYFIHTDQLDTPRAITNGSGNLVWQWDSDPFGKDAANEQSAGQQAFTFNQRLPGQQFDRESNLHYNYFRDYDPSTGRYIQSDPIGLLGGINTYGYTNGSPISYTDPRGLCIGPLFLACVFIGENTTAILAATGIGVSIFTGADVPGPAGTAGKEIRAGGQYALRAIKDGWYPIMTRGFKEPTGQMWCSAGDVWKFGKTKDFAKRYSQSYLENIGPGVRLDPEFIGTGVEGLILENAKLLNYINQTGHLPPGNKIGR